MDERELKFVKKGDLLHDAGGRKFHVMINSGEYLYVKNKSCKHGVRLPKHEALKLVRQKSW